MQKIITEPNEPDLITITGTFHSVQREGTNMEPGSINIKSNVSPNLILCEGTSANLRYRLPVIITGTWIEKGKTFHMNDIRVDVHNIKAIKKFIKDGSFQGVGITRAHIIAKTLDTQVLSDNAESRQPEKFQHEKIIWNDNIMSIQKDSDTNSEIAETNKEVKTEESETPTLDREINEEDITQICSHLKLSLQTQLQLQEALAGIYERKKILEFVKKFNGGYRDAEILYTTYQGSGISTLINDPYSNLALGISFKLCDEIAYHFNEYSPWDDHRIDAFLGQLSIAIQNNGSCCIRIKKAVNYLYHIQKDSPFKTMPRSMILSFLLSSDNFVIKESKRYGVLIYPKSLYYTEVEIVTEIKRLQNSAEAFAYQGYRGESNLDEYQIKAMEFMKSSGIKILHGGPGAGKTTTIREFIAEYKRLHSENAIVQLCAPTGRAAVRISESCDGLEKAVTIHKLIGVQVFGNQSTCMMNKENPLPKGLFILDEMSMADEDLFLKFLRAVPNGSMVILSGDPDQLPSVDTGTVLRDLIESGEIESAELGGNHRQHGGSIVENYKKIKTGNTALIEDESFKIIDCKSEKQAMDELMKLYHQFYTDDTNHFQILASVKKGSIGKNAINQNISKERRSIKKKYSKGFSLYTPGDRVLMTKNNYNKGYWNGDVGIITEAASGGGYQATFYDGIRNIDPESCKDMDLAFAMTIHKSQGSEYEIVVVVLDPAYPVMLYRSLFLTAVTRAKQKVFVISDRESIKKAITTDQEATRITGLCDLLKEMAEKKGCKF